MKKFFYNKVLVAAIAVGLVAALIIAWQRHQVETQNTQIEMAVDYESLWNIAEREGMEFGAVLTAAKNAGITSLAIYETTLEKLTRSGRVLAFSGSELIGNYYSGSLADFNWRLLIETGTIDPNKIYIVANDLNVYAEVKADLIQRIGTDRVKPISFGNNEILEVKAQYAPFMTQKLGLPTFEMEIAKDYGFNIIARPSNYSKCTAEDVLNVFDRMNGYPVTGIVFEGQEVLGYPNEIRLTAEQMGRKNINFGLIEAAVQLQFYKQEGLESLAQTLGYDRCARLYAIPKDEQPKLPLTVAVNRWATTDQERNIRINLLRIYDKPLPGMTLFESNMKYFANTTELLRSKGFTFGTASTFQDYYPSLILRALVMIGIAAAIVLYLSLISKRLNGNTKIQLAMFVVLTLLMVVPILMGVGAKVRIVAALAAANLFPTLAVIWQLDAIRFMRLKEQLRLRKVKGSERPQRVLEPTPMPQIIFLAVIALFITGAMSMAGAAYLSGALSDVEYFLEFQIFRGIKLTFILPLILVSIAFLQRFSLFDDTPHKDVDAFKQICRILELPVKVKAFLVFIVAAIGVVVMVARSGHTAGMPVSGTEIQFRQFLENLFYARPRSKELLIGHPAFMLAIMGYFKRWSKSVFFLLVIVATIGQSSMVETFAHMRTPIFMSFIRGVDGLALGAALGIIPMLVIHYYSKYIKPSNSQ